MSSRGPMVQRKKPWWDCGAGFALIVSKYALAVSLARLGLCSPLLTSLRFADPASSRCALRHNPQYKPHVTDEMRAPIDAADDS